MLRLWLVCLAALLGVCGSVWACAPVNTDLHAHAPGIWVRAGRAQDPSGWTEPVVIWVDERRVWVGDPGPHRCAGLALRREIERRWPGRTHHLINSHAHPRNVLANAAWPKGTPIHALPQTRRDMARRCPSCLNTLRQQLGEDWMRGTRIVLPNRSLQVGQVLNMAGQRWSVVELKAAHTASDLLLREAAGQGWWAPSLVAWQAVPELSRVGVAQWLAALRDLGPEPALAMVGAASAQAAAQHVSATQAYLARLDHTLRQALDQGRSQHEFYAGWDGSGLGPFQESEQRQHQLNVQMLWMLLEDADLSPPRR